MKIGVLKENKENEKRVAITPSSIPKIKNLVTIYISKKMLVYCQTLKNSTR